MEKKTNEKPVADSVDDVHYEFGETLMLRSLVVETGRKTNHSLPLKIKQQNQPLWKQHHLQKSH